jgi:hypothetical protein
MPTRPADRLVAVSLIVGGVLAAVLSFGLFTDWFGLYGSEKAPLTETRQSADETPATAPQPGS